jgi:nucleotide-binding universal stress UspA family protein
MFNRILIPLDGSPLAETIIPHVEGLARGPQLEIVLLAVVSPLRLAPLESGVSVQLLEQFLAAEEERLRLYLEQPARRLSLSGLAVTPMVRVGIPAAEIVRCAEDLEVDAIAMSTHGRTGLDYLLHGSVAETVLRTAHLPVLLFRPTKGDFRERRKVRPTLVRWAMRAAG